MHGGLQHILLSVRGADCDIDRADCDTDRSSLTLSIWLLNTGQVTAVILCFFVQVWHGSARG